MDACNEQLREGHGGGSVLARQARSMPLSCVTRSTHHPLHLELSGPARVQLCWLTAVMPNQISQHETIANAFTGLGPCQDPSLTLLIKPACRQPCSNQDVPADELQVCSSCDTSVAVCLCMFRNLSKLAPSISQRLPVPCRSLITDYKLKQPRSGVEL
jgi:hypothetical protein